MTSVITRRFYYKEKDWVFETKLLNNCVSGFDDKRTSVSPTGLSLNMYR